MSQLIHFPLKDIWVVSSFFANINYVPGVHVYEIFFSVCVCVYVCRSDCYVIGHIHTQLFKIMSNGLPKVIVPIYILPNSE